MCTPRHHLVPVAGFLAGALAMGVGAQDTTVDPPREVWAASRAEVACRQWLGAPTQVSAADRAEDARKVRLQDFGARPAAGLAHVDGAEIGWSTYP